MTPDTTEVTLTVRLKVTVAGGDWTFAENQTGEFHPFNPDGAAFHFTKLFAEYLTLPESAFLEDYGPRAWGGYDGPKVAAVEVLDGEHRLAHWEAQPNDWDNAE